MMETEWRPESMLIAEKLEAQMQRHVAWIWSTGRWPGC